MSLFEKTLFTRTNYADTHLEQEKAMAGFPKSLISFPLFLAPLLLLLLLQISHVLSISDGGRGVNHTAIIAQAVEAGISIERANNIANALEFERSNWATGSVASDEFYSNVPRSNASAGTLLKVQVNVNTSAYSLPPNTALSRIIFVSESLNGSKIPASAYVLWPYAPRSQEDGYAVVGWAHGTSGIFGDCGPSHQRNLMYHFAAPFTLALQGYVVVAPDYAGLGVDKDGEGKSIKHVPNAASSHANDLFYSVQAAQTAFKELSQQFVLFGHSQGGGVVWRAAARQATRPVAGYLGAIAASPVSPEDVLIPEATSVAAVLVIAYGLSTIYPDFTPADILTPAGLKRLDFVIQIQGCGSVFQELFEPTLIRPDWRESIYAVQFLALGSEVGLPVAGPFLILEGEADLITRQVGQEKAINSTCSLHPDSRLEYKTFANVTHVPVVYASQRVWLDWIRDRFAGVETPSGCRRSRVESARPYYEYQKEVNWFLSQAEQAYELA